MGYLPLYLTTDSNSWNNRFTGWSAILPPQLHPSTRLLLLLHVLHTWWQLPLLFAASSHESYWFEIWKNWLADANCHYPHENWESSSFLMEQLGVLLSLHLPLIWVYFRPVSSTYPLQHGWHNLTGIASFPKRSKSSLKYCKTVEGIFSLKGFKINTPWRSDFSSVYVF